MNSEPKKLEQSYQLSITSDGAPLIDIGTLEAIVDRGVPHGVELAILEVFMVDGDLFVPCLEYGLFWGELEGEIRNMNGVDRAKFMRSTLGEILEDIKKVGGSYVFNVWLASKGPETSPTS